MQWLFLYVTLIVRQIEKEALLMEQPLYTLRFTDGIMKPKKESAARTVSIVLLCVAGGIFLLLVLAFGFEIIKDFSLLTLALLIYSIGVLVSQSGREMAQTPCELQFYGDYLIQFCPRRYYNRKKIRQEYYKFYYRNITRCVYRAGKKHICFMGKVDALFYSYDKNGNLSGTPDKRVVADSTSSFYTGFAPEINFVQEIETHSPLHVESE